MVMTELNENKVSPDETNQSLDLKTKEGIAAYMSASESAAEWDRRYDEIKKIHNGHLPVFWARLIEEDGLAQKTILKWKK